MKTILKMLTQNVPKIPIATTSSFDKSLKLPCRPADKLTNKNNDDCQPRQFQVTLKG